MYKKFGSKCLEKLNGMFSFAIWNCEKKELFCARDRFGVKPFYFIKSSDFFAFASEIKALNKIDNFNSLMKNIKDYASQNPKCNLEKYLYGILTLFI